MPELYVVSEEESFNDTIDTDLTPANEDKPPMSEDQLYEAAAIGDPNEVGRFILENSVIKTWQLLIADMVRYYREVKPNWATSLEIVRHFKLPSYSEIPHYLHYIADELEKFQDILERTVEEFPGCLDHVGEDDRKENYNLYVTLWARWAAFDLLTNKVESYAIDHVEAFAAGKTAAHERIISPTGIINYVEGINLNVRGDEETWDLWNETYQGFEEWFATKAE